MKKTLIKLYDLQGNYLQDFESIREASEALGLKPTNISLALRTTTKCWHYQFRYANCSTENIGDISIKKERKMPISKYWGDNLICVYGSLREASIKNDVNQGNISKAIRTGHKVKGFNFKLIK